MVMTRSETSRASRQATTERPPSTRYENEAVFIATTSCAQRNAPLPSALPPRTVIATDAAYRLERELRERAFRAIGQLGRATGAPPPRAPSSYATKPYRDVTSVAAAASMLGATQGLHLTGPSSQPTRTAIATDVAYRPERIRESTEHAFRTMGVTGAPLPRASYSHAIAPHHDVTSVAAAASTLGATQGLPLTGPSSQPTQDRTLPSTYYAQCSPTRHNSGVRYHHVTSPSTPTTTIDVATDNVAAPPASADFMPHCAAPLLTTSGRTTTKKSSRQSERLLRIARAKEEYARLQVQLAAAHIETLEAEAQAEEENRARIQSEHARTQAEHARVQEKEARTNVQLAAFQLPTPEVENKEDACTSLTDENVIVQSQQRVDIWLSEQQIVSMRDDNHRRLTALPLMPPPPPQSMPATAAQLQLPVLATTPTAGANAIESLTAKTPVSDPEQCALETLQEHYVHVHYEHYETALRSRNNDEMPNNNDASLRRLISVKQMKKVPISAIRHHVQTTALVKKGYAELTMPRKGQTYMDTVAKQHGPNDRAGDRNRSARSLPRVATPNGHHLKPKPLPPRVAIPAGVPQPRTRRASRRRRRRKRRRQHAYLQRTCYMVERDRKSHPPGSQQHYPGGRRPHDWSSKEARNEVKHSTDNARRSRFRMQRPGRRCTAGECSRRAI